jgi:hypothetical protein
VRALAGTGFVLALLSLGTEIVFKGRHSRLPGPWWPFAHVPGLRSIPPADLALAIVPFVILVLTLLVDRGQEVVDELHRTRPALPARLAWYGLLVAALLPLAPAPIRTMTASPPRFVQDGTWRAYVPAGRSMVAVPAGAAGSPTLRWTVATDLTLPLAGVELGSALGKAGRSGKVQNVTDSERTAVLDDLRYARVSAVVLVPQRNQDALRMTTSSLLGLPPVWVDGLWLWDLRASGVA